jgi:hypothetical protein
MTLSAAEALLALVIVALTSISVLLVVRKSGGNGWKTLAEELMVQRNDAMQLARARGGQLDEVGIPAISSSEIRAMRELAAEIDRKFSLDEMTMLAMDIDIDPDQIPGATGQARALSLVRAADRRNKLQPLIHAIQIERPS